MSGVAGRSRGQIIVALVAWQYVLQEPITEAWDVIEEGGAASHGPDVFAHVAGGVPILALMAWRVALRLREGAPPPPAGERPALRLLAGVEAAAEGHSVMRVILLALVAVHVAGALAHRFVFRSGVMERMPRPVR